MSVRFNADEIFEMAQEVERNGAKFYRTVSRSAPDQGCRQLLTRLAEMEVAHEKTFKAMRAKLAEKSPREEAYDPQGDAALYLQAFADGHVFVLKADPTARLTGKETMEEILKTAIGLEKDSIVFYVGIRDLVGKDLGQDRIEGIIREEMGHVTDLSGQLAALSQ